MKSIIYIKGAQGSGKSKFVRSLSNATEIDVTVDQNYILECFEDYDYVVLNERSFGKTKIKELVKALDVKFISVKIH